jgi:hypothetical protein
MAHDPAAPARRLSPHVPEFQGTIQTKGVLFGVPCYGGQIFDACMQGLLDTQKEFLRLGISFNLVTIRNESLIPRGRNGIVQHFLASGCDRLFFIDADIGFDAQQVLRILAHDRDVVAGLYRKKRLETVDFAVNWLPSPDGKANRDPATGAIEARHLATGFLCIKRGVIETMCAAYPHLRYRAHASEREAGRLPEFGHALFATYIDPVTLEDLSEDWAFCMRWRALGGQVWADPGVILEHYGTVPLSADPMEHIAGGAALADLRAQGAHPRGG